MGLRSGASRLLVFVALVAGFAVARPAAAQISGRFSPPVEGVTVVLLRGDQQVASTSTSADGSFSFSGLAPGTYRVEVRNWPSDKGSPPPGQRFTVRGGTARRTNTLTFWLYQIDDMGDDAWSQLQSIWNEHRLVVYLAAALLVAALVARNLLRRRAWGPRVESTSRTEGPVSYPELEAAREEGVEELDRYRQRLAPLAKAHPRHVVQLYLAYRDHKAWSEMYSVIKEMPAWLKGLTVVRQQLGFALNRDGKDKEAEKTLRKLLKKGDGRNAETYGILARVYKDRWERAVDAGDTKGAAKLLEEAINGYLAGFNADPGNAYPGLNALTLMEFYDERPEERASLLREVTVAVHATYWGHAARLELAVLSDEEDAAREALEAALASPHTRWEIETTFRNLRLVRTARMQYGRPWADWQREVVAAVEEEATKE